MKDKSLAIFLIIIAALTQISLQQCSCPQTNAGAFDFSGIAPNTRTLVATVTAGRSYDITIPSNTDTVTFDTCGASVDTYLSLYSTSCALLDFNDDFCNFQSKITYTTNGRTQFRVIVNGISCSSNAFASSVRLYVTVTPIVSFPIPPHFLPFGQTYGDTILPRCDDCSTAVIALPEKIQYYQKKYSQLFMNTNGVVTTNFAIYSTTPLNFPDAGEYEGTPLIAPFWADADTRNQDGGYVMYRVSTDPAPSSDSEISTVFNTTFVSDMHVVMTWYKVGYFPEEVDLLNTFQLVIFAETATNITIAKITYAEDGINWVTGSGGLNGFGGFPAKVGFDRGDGSTYFELENSYTEDIQFIDDSSNVGLTGVYYYRIDNKTVIDPSACIPAVSCKQSVALNVGDIPSFEDVNDNSTVCPSTNVWVTPNVISCAMYPSSTLRLHLDYFSCALPVTVSDPYPPSFPDCTSGIYTYKTDSDICASRFTPNVTDNCGISQPPSQFLAPLGASSHNFTTYDIAGNSAWCVFNLNIVDIVPPVAQCKHASVYLNSTGGAVANVIDIDNSSFDNCQVASRSLSHASFTCNHLPTSYALLTVIDTFGNSATCNASVSVFDQINPTPQCKPSIVVPIITNSAPILPSYIDNASSDNCQIASRVLSVSTITCANTVTPLAVTMTVTDQSGNSAPCSSNVYAADITPPTARCKDITYRFVGTENFIVITPADIDDNSFDNCEIATRNILGNDELPKGGIGGPIRMIVTDVNGLNSTCTSFVTTPIGRTDFLIVPEEISMFIPFTIEWPSTSDFPANSLISLRAIDTETYFETPIVSDFLFSRHSYTVSNGLHGVSPNHNYLIIMTQANIDYASAPVFLNEFKNKDN